MASDVLSTAEPGSSHTVSWPPGIPQDNDIENEDEEGWGRMSQVEGAQPSSVMGWCGHLAAAEPMGKLVGTGGVQWCHLGGAEGSIMGIPNWVLRRSRNPNSRDQVNLPPASWQVSKAGAKAQGLTGSEYVHSFNNIH